MTVGRPVDGDAHHVDLFAGEHLVDRDGLRLHVLVNAHDAGIAHALVDGDALLDALEYRDRCVFAESRRVGTLSSSRVRSSGSDEDPCAYPPISRRADLERR